MRSQCKELYMSKLVILNFLTYRPWICVNYPHFKTGSFEFRDNKIIGIILRASWPCGDDCTTVMSGHLQITPIDDGFIAVCLRHSRFQIVRYNDCRSTLKIGKSINMPMDKRLKVLGPMGFYVRVVTRAQDCHENLCLLHLTSIWVNYLNSWSSVVHEQLFATTVVLVHGDIQFLLPLSIALTELAVLVSIRIFLPILNPQELQRDAFSV